MSAKLGSKLNPEGTTYAAYVRVSTNAQAEEGYSIDIQTEKLKTYITQIVGSNNYKLYVDDGYSGSTLDRPAMQRLIADVKDNKIKGVYVVKLDRLSRSQKDTLYLIEDVFLSHDVFFMSLNESFDTSTPFGRAMVGILSVFAQLERENIFERTRGGMQKRVESGLWMGGGRVPFGYDYDKTRGILVPNNDAKRVKKLYELFLKGFSLNYIADVLNLKYDRLARQILTRKSNAGYIVYNGVSYKGQHEAIIDLDTYESAMMMLNEKSSRRYTTYETHLLTGLVVCGKCGAKMRYSRWGNGRYKLTCYSQQTSKKYLIKDPNCDNAKVWADEVENEVIKDIFSLSSALKGTDVTPKDDSTNTLDILKEQFETTNNKLRRLYDLYSSQQGSTLLSVIEETKKALDEITLKIDEEVRNRTVTKTITRTKELVKNVSAAWEYMTVIEKKNLIHSVVKCVTVDGNEVSIDYNF